MRVLSILHHLTFRVIELLTSWPEVVVPVDWLWLLEALVVHLLVLVVVADVVVDLVVDRLDWVGTIVN